MQNKEIVFLEVLSNEDINMIKKVATIYALLAKLGFYYSGVTNLFFKLILNNQIFSPTFKASVNGANGAISIPAEKIDT